MDTIMAIILAILASLFPVAPAASSGSSAVLQGSSYAPAHEDSDIEETDPAELLDARQIGWERYDVIDADSIRVGFWGGVENCYGFYTEVEETPQSVTVNLYSGNIPSEGDCIDPALYHTVVVDLDSPLNARQVRGQQAE